jgi:acyl dehydratase
MPVLAPHVIEAANLSTTSENRIHDDDVARSLGFTGGLVPGVEVYAYACHQPVARWGREFLTRGEIMCRFLKPVYDGHTVSVGAEETASGLTLNVESDGVLCATGSAALPGATVPPALPDTLPPQPPAADQRPAASEASLPTGRALGIKPDVIDAGRLATYLAAIRENDPLYAREGIVHPGLLLRLCNSALKDNVLLAPWIHTGSHVRNFALARVGDELSVAGTVARNYENKGHRLVDLDLLLIANGRTVLAHVLHTAIYALRHLAEKRA